MFRQKCVCGVSDIQHVCGVCSDKVCFLCTASGQKKKNMLIVFEHTYTIIYISFPLNRVGRMEALCKLRHHLVAWRQDSKTPLIQIGKGNSK